MCIYNYIYIHNIYIYIMVPNYQKTYDMWVVYITNKNISDRIGT